MAIQKFLCPQCGSNELELFGSSAYKCESCGTILKEEKPKETPIPSSVQKPKQKPFRSKRVQHGLDDQPDFAHDPLNENHHEAGGEFIKLIFWIGVLSAVGGLVVWLFM